MLPEVEDYKNTAQIELERGSSQISSCPFDYVTGEVNQILC